MAEIDRVLSRGPGGQAGGQPDQGDTDSLTARAILENIASDPTNNAMSRANAARALAEMDGQLGRHALPPVRDTQDVATLSRADLVRELERLRAAHSAA